MLSTGCQWNALPTGLPPKSTLYDYLDPWDWDGTLERIHHTLYLAVRKQAGRDAGPTVAIIDAQSAKGGATWRIEIVKRNELHRFVVLPKRWIVERTLAWISQNRHLARDFERDARSVTAFIRLAMIRLMLRRLTAPSS